MYNLGELTGTVKHYDWGGPVFIPLLIQQENVGDKPFAEYWLGVHPQADCKIIFPNGEIVLLRDYIQQHTMEALGKYTGEKFHGMPYLMKALEVKEMLSIQVHPTKAAAEEDFELENKKRIALDSPQRNYKDGNHKPELMVAMGKFWLLHGFKPEQQMREVLERVPELIFLITIFVQSGYGALYQQVMEMPQEEVNTRLQPLLDRILPLYQAGKLEKTNEDYWAARGHLGFSQPGRIDRGIFSVYLFNLLRLEKGEAVFQAAGVPHAYLEGCNVELMASSDNVLRGGLTNKHVDVPELLKHVKTEATDPDILRGNKQGKETTYKTPAPDFELRYFELGKQDSVSFTPTTAEILLLTKGSATLTDGQVSVELQMGHPSAVVFPGKELTLLAGSESDIYRATVPVNK